MTKSTSQPIRYTGIQPQYFPRLHYFSRIIQTDIFALRDDAQFVRKHKYPDGRTDKSYQGDTPIKQAYGSQLLSIPLQHQEETFLPIKNTKISYSVDWVERHLKTIHLAYANSPFFTTIFPEIESLLTSKYEDLATLDIATTLWGLLRIIGVTDITPSMLSISSTVERIHKAKNIRLRRIERASESAALQDSSLKTNEKIVGLILEYGATEDYCGGTGVSAYVDHDLFSKQGITINVQNWKCREYPQQFTKQQGFIPNLSLLDLLFHVPSQVARDILIG
jgi:hypothetical protein